LGIQVTSRHDSVTDGMKRYAHEKAEKLKRIFDGLGKVEIILDGQGLVQRAEAVIHVAGSGNFAVHAEAPKMNAAIDAMIDKAEAKVRRHKERIRDHHSGPEGPRPAPARGDEDLESYQDVIEGTDFPSPDRP